MIAFVIAAQSLAAQAPHSWDVSVSPLCLLSFASGGAPLLQAGVRAQAGERFAVGGPFSLSGSLGMDSILPSGYSGSGLRYRAYSSAFAALACEASLPSPSSYGPSVESGASLHLGSYGMTTLVFAMAEAFIALHLPDPAPRPFYAGWSLDGQPSLRARLIIPLSFRFSADGFALSLGLCASLRQDGP